MGRLFCKHGGSVILGVSLSVCLFVMLVCYVVTTLCKNNNILIGNFMKNISLDKEVPLNFASHPHTDRCRLGGGLYARQVVYNYYYTSHEDRSVL